ncbi:MAG: GAP family protein [Chloroflexota bacterium]|nr:GAP family protein [Chloroflexota bacterium]
MIERWLTIVLLALTVGFLPLQFGVTVFLLGQDDGTKKASGLVGGVALFRVLVAAVFVVFFAGAAAAMGDLVTDIAGTVQSAVAQIGTDISSGRHGLVNLFLIAAAILLLYYTGRRLRSVNSKSNSAAKGISNRVAGIGAGSVLVFSVVWAAGGMNQWILTIAGVSQLMAMPVQPPTKVFGFGLFLLLSSLMLLLPILFVFIRPESARTHLEAADRWVNGALRHVITLSLSLIGIYFLWIGALGLTRFF